MTRSTRNQSKSTPPKSEFVQVVEKYLQEAGWTNQELMNEIQVGETQFYRWARGDSVPRKAIVNRIAVSLARRLDQTRQKLPHDPFPASDEIDGIVNELLEAAGYRSAVKGKGADYSWHEIAKNQSWTLGYTEVPTWSQIPDKPGSPPTGLAIKYAEQIGRLLGINTIWEYLTWQEMPLAIRERRVHGIAPFFLALPERFFDYRFSQSCREEPFSLSAVLVPVQGENFAMLEDLPNRRVQLLHVRGEIGSWAAAVLSDSYQHQEFEDRKKAISHLLATAGRANDVIPVFLSDSLTCQYISNENNLQVIKIERLKNIKTAPAFAFHPDEKKLTTAVNSAIEILPKIQIK
ncbi:substrate-binding periplasmic protein [Scytonema hofmannii]|uniref:substrate-binding periplasmic protein n=1 Tax=Scytonema hofmannii TaxID=34078 RepID=UPI000347B3F3|nr:transporter substrate-binding domain-containing protein [Scytonema hofmannii]